ncbi:toxin [Bifidobacterium aerophilum]|uniref:toxin n=1 Tax=Bifidobacterium aerophilum TaxID=1798155 RepID=UPI00195457DD|nr:toxin [Bifidobacterium aerophilum]
MYYNNRIRVVDAAGKHGIDPDDATYVAEHCLDIRVLCEEPYKELRLGVTSTGMPLEIVLVPAWDGDGWVIIHAMKMRLKYRMMLNRRALWLR